MEKLRVLDPNTGRTEDIPGGEPVGVDEFGKLRVGAARARGQSPASLTTCERERMFLASIDNEQYFRELMDLANRNNASFYPIDPRGLAVFDSPIGPGRPPPVSVDIANLKNRIETLARWRTTRTGSPW